MRFNVHPAVLQFLQLQAENADVSDDLDRVADFWRELNAAHDDGRQYVISARADGWKRERG